MRIERFEHMEAWEPAREPGSKVTFRSVKFPFSSHASLEKFRNGGGTVFLDQPVRGERKWMI